MIESEHFIIWLWDWDKLCLQDVRTKPNLKTWDLGTIVNDRDFIILVSTFALNLAEEIYYKKD